MSILGIDLGTTLNKIACFNPYGLRITINNNKSPATPSAAYVDKKDRWYFGERAVKYGISKPKQCIYETKLMLGRKFEDPFIQKRRKLWKFETQADEEGRIKIIIKINKQTKEFYAYQILGKILQNLVEVANINLPAKTRQVIISIPYSFNQQQIDELILSTKLAQLQVIRFITEPVSTTLAYLHNLRLDIRSRHNFLIYDLGTSTINAFIIKTYEDPKRNEIISKTNYEINGQTFEENIYDYLEKNEIETKIDSKTELKLRIACKEAKTILSEVNSTDIIIDNEEEEEEEKGINIALTEEKFNEINEKLFEEIMKPVKEVIEESKINKETIEQVFLVGGSTYMKELRTKLKTITGKESCTVVDPRESIALGCCIAGSTFSVDEILQSKGISDEPIKTILKQKPVFFDDLEKFGKFDNEIGISFGFKDEIIAQENQQIPCIIEKEFELENECKQIKFFEKDSSNSFYDVDLKHPISGKAKLNIQITFKQNKQNEPILQFYGNFGQEIINYSDSNHKSSKPSRTIIYKEFIKQTQESITDSFNQFHTPAQIKKELGEDNLSSQESINSNGTPNSNAFNSTDKQNSVFNNIPAKSNSDAYSMSTKLYRYSYSAKQLKKLLDKQNDDDNNQAEEKEVEQKPKEEEKDKQKITSKEKEAKYKSTAAEENEQNISSEEKEIEHKSAKEEKNKQKIASEEKEVEQKPATEEENKQKITSKEKEVEQKPATEEENKQKITSKEKEIEHKSTAIEENKQKIASKEKEIEQKSTEEEKNKQKITSKEKEVGHKSTEEEKNKQKRTSKEKEVGHKSTEEEKNKQKRASKEKEIEHKSTEEEKNKQKRTSKEKEIEHKSTEEEKNKQKITSKEKEIEQKSTEEEKNKQKRTSKEKEIEHKSTEEEKNKQKRTSKEKEVGHKSTEEEKNKQKRTSKEKEGNNPAATGERNKPKKISSETEQTLNVQIKIPNRRPPSNKKK